MPFAETDGAAFIHSGSDGEVAVDELQQRGVLDAPLSELGIVDLGLRGRNEADAIEPDLMTR